MMRGDAARQGAEDMIDDLLARDWPAQQAA